MRLSTRNALLGVIRNSRYVSYRHGHAYIAWRCYSDAKNRTYDDAINLLNTLQTPYAELKRQWDAGIRRGQEDLDHTKQCLGRLGYTENDLTKLNIVHVAGTKGKGTVCGYVESILGEYRKLALDSETRDLHQISLHKNIGLYTSPHLISVRERIRINSAPISEELFTKYFFEVWDKICEPDADGKQPVSPKPVYFRFLTLMSFHVFLSESIDVAVYEVGMGGQYDATNIIKRPSVTGISSLGIDHTFHLGNTIESIAWHKSGIFKGSTPAYTVQQPWPAMAVLSERAYQRRARGFHCVDENPSLKDVKIKPDATFQRQNASLAIALARKVLLKVNRDNVDLEEELKAPGLPERFVRGLESIASRGRCEVRVDGNTVWYLDGAHTADSIIVASKWFCDEVKDKPEPRVLIFNQQGHRETIELLERLFAATERQLKFDHVIFCPSTPPASSTKKDHVNLQTDLEAVASLTVQQKFADKWQELSAERWPGSKTEIKVLPSLEEAFDYVRSIGSTGTESERVEGEKVRVFITGSIHLVGRALNVLEGVDAL
ncbi:FolC bifunctional protein [Mollisia scopiformis]|uniref:Folylpolyglutamate synthase n=1 Tax=Mollisia scopiformis TaxID=149040 RepID=A0A194XUB9_MOLSC|nr:FolC bifunctional protein [Mollisia scopiformis]KUJ23915.1 FolC bifunctional protein [Mollisia scopiformis]